MSRLEYKWIIHGDDITIESITPLLRDEINVAVLTVNTGLSDFSLIKAYINATIATSNELCSILPTVSKIDSDECVSPLTLDTRRLINATLHKNMEIFKNDLSLKWVIHSSVSHLNGKPSMIETGNYSNGQLNLYRDHLYPNDHSGLNGRRFLVTSLPYSFFQKKTVIGNLTIWEGLTFDILNQLAQDLNFTYDVIEPADGNWGIDIGNGSWNGMMGQVIRGEVDFASASFSITAARQFVGDFAAPYFRDQSVIIMKLPEGNDKLRLYLKPFRPEVWLSLVSAVLITGVFFWLISAYNPYYKERHSKIKKKESFFYGPTALLYVYGYILQQGSDHMPKSSSGRFLIGCFWFFSLVIAATYTGNLIAFLAISTVDLPFNSLEELVQQDAMSYGPARAVALVMLFRDSKLYPYTEVAKTMTEVKNYEIAMKQVRTGKFAFIAEKSYYAAVSADDCDLVMARQEFYPTDYGWITKMREGGLLNKWMKNRIPKNLQCKGLGPVTKAKVATLEDFQGVFYVFLGGVVLASLIEAEELLSDRLIKQPKQDKEIRIKDSEK
ncbi:DgyrCDS5493 [Dimorphilus gyrociliatus]|uniref:DgyrCDS5493 n=1 Tax=Dimorphilus gyrociliatus TaxID=2664684 RepID=A0A7I8VMR2_9ANNE|nr:DgyrCDS5493 [Dimorphilus gyrociliatus]